MSYKRNQSRYSIKTIRNKREKIQNNLSRCRQGSDEGTMDALLKSKIISDSL